MVIGIEGQVASGKSSICKKLLEYIPNSIFIDGSSIYRAIVYVILKQGLKLEDLKDKMKNIDPKSLMDKLKVSFKIENRQTVIYHDGEKIDDKDLHTNESSTGVSMAIQVADNKMLYQFANNIITIYADKFNIIVSARDLLSIYPQMDYHFYITSSLDTRVERRYLEFDGKISKQEIKNNILSRDNMHQNSGFYKKSDKTILVDVTECKSVEESTKKVLENIKL